MPGDPRFDWLDEIPLAPGPPDLRMGLRSFDLAGWLPVDSLTESELQLRQQLLATHPEVVQLDPDWPSSVYELSQLVEDHLDRPLVDSDDPMEKLSGLAVAVPDDFLIMGRGADHWRLVGGCLLFPNHWNIGAKMGLTLAEIHGPVDGYEQLLADKMDGFFDRLTVDRPVWRRNWFIHDDANFFKPDPEMSPAITDPDKVDSLWVRSEWQTVRRLVETEAIVFTVKTQVAPISEARDRPKVAAGIAEFLAAASERSLDNKHALHRERAIIHYLTA